MNPVLTIDTNYAGMKQVASAYLLREAGRGVVVETNTTHAIPLILDQMQTHSITKTDLDFVIVTHVHLDHAGGAWALLDQCPNAILLAHPKTAKHLMDPKLLIKSATSVYGEENFANLYGEIRPIPKERIRIMEDGEWLDWQNRKFQFIYTKGHANHHFCIYEKKENIIFTGDSFGISYPHLENGSRFIFPTTTPTDFLYEEAVLSLNKIVNTGAEYAYLTHFGPVSNLPLLALGLKDGLRLCQNAIEGLKKIPNENRLGFAETQVKQMIQTLADKNKVELTENDWELLDLDVNLNAQGLVFAFERSQK
ncbi:MBL fold metallo-hydrolase [Leptospira sp. 96542]|nr:MBL fold metallo-hydrolase [Leptospira sp. 96542]